MESLELVAVVVETNIMVFLAAPTNHGTGGSGVVIVRYQIGTSGQPEGFTARATGGAVVLLVAKQFIPSLVLVSLLLRQH